MAVDTKCVDIQVFEHEMFGDIRGFYDADGNVWFVAKDIAEALGYKDPENAIAQHCNEAYKIKRHIQTQTGVKKDGSPVIRKTEVVFISVLNVYRLVARCKLPTTEKFEQWIYEKVMQGIHNCVTGNH